MSNRVPPPAEHFEHSGDYCDDGYIAHLPEIADIDVRGGLLADQALPAPGLSVDEVNAPHDAPRARHLARNVESRGEVPA